MLAARSAPVGASRNPGLLVRGNGTSFATPHVTGAVALCFEAAGNRLSAAQIRSLVLGSCDPVPDADPEYRLGHGYLNIPRLLADVQQALAAPASAPGAKEPTMATEDTIVLLAAAPPPHTGNTCTVPAGRSPAGSATASTWWPGRVSASTGRCSRVTSSSRSRSAARARAAASRSRR